MLILKWIKSEAQLKLAKCHQTLVFFLGKRSNAPKIQSAHFKAIYKHQDFSSTMTEPATPFARRFGLYMDSAIIGGIVYFPEFIALMR